MQNKKILIICPFYPPNLGGVETHLQHLTDYLIENQYTVSVLSYKPLTSQVEYKPFEKKKNLEINRFWWFGRGWFDRLTPYPILQFFYIVPGLLFYSFLWMSKNNRQVEVIHAHGFAAGFITRIIGIFFPKRKVISTHFIYKKLKPNSLYGQLSKWVFGGFDQILLVGKESGKELTKIGLNPHHMTPFHHWLNLKNIKIHPKTDCRQQLALNINQKLIVIYIGRIIKMKGVFELLKLSRLFSQLTFILVGDGPDYEVLKRKSQNRKNFLLVGRKNYQEVFNYLGASDILILPSLAEEAQPMVIMEALAAGRPVIVTDKGAAKEMIDSSVGFVTTPKINQIAKIIKKLSQDKHLLETITKNCRPYANKHFSSGNAKTITRSYHG